MARDEENLDRERRRAINQQRLVKTGNPLGTPAAPLAPTPETAGGEAYNYRDPGMFGDPRYSYQVGDEFSGPGPEPPRDSPEWPAWKRHAAAWRNFIGGRQQYVNSMIATGYDPEDLGIFNRKEEGQAGYRRLTQNNGAEIARLRQHGEEYMRGTDAEIDPVTGLYITGGPSNRSYFDARGMRVNAQGGRIGGFYGSGNTVGQYGMGAIPRTLGNQTGPIVRPGTPNRMQPVPAPAPAAPIVPQAQQQQAQRGGWTNYMPRRNRQTQLPQSPYGI